MKIITEEPLNIFSQLLIPIIFVLLSSSIPLIILRYLSPQEKNQYIRVLNKSCPCIEAFSYHLSQYRILQLKSYICFEVGIVTSFFIPKYLIYICLNDPFIYKLIEANIITINNYYLSTLPIYELTKLNLITVVSTYIDILIIIICICISAINRPHLFGLSGERELCYPSLTASGELTASAKKVHKSYLLFEGIIFGANILAFTLFYTILDKNLVVINDNLFNWTFFTVTDPNTNSIHLTYLGFNALLWLCGALLSLMSIVELFVLSKWSSNDFINSIMNYYKHKFPYISLKTESGEVKGQLIDIRNKSLISLQDNDILKIVPWNKIVVMEVCNISKDVHTILDNGSTEDLNTD